MPSRFAFYSSLKEIEEKFKINGEDMELHPYYNLKPTNRATGIINDGENKLVRLRWGFVKGKQFFKARGESVHEKRLFSKGFHERRCIILANGFFEWNKEDKKRIPYYFSLKDEDLFAIAGVYNAKRDEKDDKMKYQFAVITTEANSIVKKIFHRMPVIIPTGNIKNWLDPKQKEKVLRDMLIPYSPEKMTSWQVKPLPSKGDNGPETITAVKTTGLREFL